MHTQAQIIKIAKVLGRNAVGNELIDVAFESYSPSKGHVYPEDRQTETTACGVIDCLTCRAGDQVWERGMSLISSPSESLELQTLAISSMRQLNPFGHYLRKVARRSARQASIEIGRWIETIRIQGHGPGWRQAGDLSLTLV